MPRQKVESPATYIAALAEPRRSQIKQLHDVIQKTVPKLKPYIMGGMGAGSAMIGYGKFHYRYPSGREGDWALIALASQKNYISVYVCAADGKQYVAEKYTKELPKASIGKSCIRFKKVEDIDLSVLKRILKEGEKLGGVGVVK